MPILRQAILQEKEEDLEEEGEEEEEDGEIGGLGIPYCKVYLHSLHISDVCSAGVARCQLHSTCVNVEGGYICDCDVGFAPWGCMCLGVSVC